MSPQDVTMAIIASVFASSGLWTLVNNIYQTHKEKKSVERRALLGLLHEQLIDKGEAYLAQGWISTQDLEDFTNYIYCPYHDLGGNGTGETLYKKLVALNNTPS